MRLHIKTTDKVEDLIVKYLSNEISNEELETLNEWLKNTENQTIFKEYRRINALASVSLQNTNVEEQFGRLQEKIINTKKPVRKLRQRVLKYAAILILFLGTSAVLYQLVISDNLKTFPEESNEITLQLADGTIKIVGEKTSSIVANDNKFLGKNAQVAKDGNQELLYNTLSVPYGKRIRLVLSDGTNAVLNSGTKLKYPTNFIEGHSRVVYLDGEAYFSVTKSLLHDRFLVNTRDLDVQVYGTKFNVSSYQNEQKTAATLVEGSIAVKYAKTESSKTKELFVKPGEAAIISNGAIVIQNVNTSKYTAWVEGKLIFNDDRFGDITKKLERFYNVKIINEYPEINEYRYNGVFDIETISQLLDAFKVNTPFKYTINDNIVTIKKP